MPEVVPPSKPRAGMDRGRRVVLNSPLLANWQDMNFRKINDTLKKETNEDTFALDNVPADLVRMLVILNSSIGASVDGRDVQRPVKEYADLVKVNRRFYEDDHPTRKAFNSIIKDYLFDLVREANSSRR